MKFKQNRTALILILATAMLLTAYGGTTDNSTDTQGSTNELSNVQAKVDVLVKAVNDLDKK